jgi:hypothetical protein
MSFEFLYFLRITADLQETSQFYYFKYDKSDRKLHFFIKEIFLKICCTGNPFITNTDLSILVTILPV